MTWRRLPRWLWNDKRRYRAICARCGVVVPLPRELIGYLMYHPGGCDGRLNLCDPIPNSRRRVFRLSRWFKRGPWRGLCRLGRWVRGLAWDAVAPQVLWMAVAKGLFAAGVVVFLAWLFFASLASGCTAKGGGCEKSWLVQNYGTACDTILQVDTIPLTPGTYTVTMSVDTTYTLVKGDLWEMGRDSWNIGFVDIPDSLYRRQIDTTYRCTPIVFPVRVDTSDVLLLVPPCDTLDEPIKSLRYWDRALNPMHGWHKRDTATVMPSHKCDTLRPPHCGAPPKERAGQASDE